MAHTDRDDDQWFWKDHWDGEKCVRHQRVMVDGWSFRRTQHCWCEKRPDAHMRLHPYREEWGLPAWWNKDCRREERAKARDQMNKARNGHIDWDDLTINYRRPWYY